MDKHTKQFLKELGVALLFILGVIFCFMALNLYKETKELKNKVEVRELIIETYEVKNDILERKYDELREHYLLLEDKYYVLLNKSKNNDD